MHQHGPLARIARSAGRTATFRMRGLSNQMFFDDASLDGYAYKLGVCAFPWTDRGVLLAYEPPRVEGLPDHVIALDLIDAEPPAAVYLAQVRDLISRLGERVVNSILLKFHPGTTPRTVQAALAFIGRSKRSATNSANPRSTLTMLSRAGSLRRTFVGASLRRAFRRSGLFHLRAGCEGRRRQQGRIADPS